MPNIEVQLMVSDRTKDRYQTEWRFYFNCQYEAKEKLQNRFSRKGNFIISLDNVSFLEINFCSSRITRGIELKLLKLN